jgi:hypothetical protein
MSSMLHRITLVGGFSCEISCDESNRWNQYVIETAEFRNLLTLTAKRNNLLSLGGSAEEFRVIEMDRLATERALFDLAKAWFSGLSKERTEVPWYAELTAKTDDGKPKKETPKPPPPPENVVA